MSQAPRAEELAIEGPAGTLEALLEAPRENSPDTKRARIAILCHPHPQHQGTMQNKVVHTLARAMHDLNIGSLRFNFRGVGGSTGVYGGGEGELDDVLAVADYAKARWPAAQLWLGGFSFGAVIAARAATTVAARQLITIAPAVNFLGKQLKAQPDMPWLIIQGDEDDIVPVDEVINWVDQLEPGPELVIMSGVGHFFHGSLVQLRQTLVANLETNATDRELTNAG
jgi:alpha/beta superfamily hydrolase